MNTIEIWERFKSLDQNSCFVIDSNVFKLFSSLFAHINLDKCLFINEPENSKNWDGAQKVLQFFSNLNLYRNNTVYAIGGGALMDLVGFCAAIFKRGVVLNFIPTTLLGMIDAAIGGKNGINFNQAKNLVGTFYPPQKVIYYLPFLETLPKEQLLSGFAEALKIGLIYSEEVWKNLDYTSLKMDDILSCARIKQTIVEKDLYDKGIRHILNFGHTIGHAYESASSYKLPHGYCVAFGMIAESAFSFHRGELIKKAFDEIKKRHFSLFPLTEPLAFEKLKPFLAFDKKNRNNFILIHSLTKIGQNPELVEASLEECQKAVEALWI